MFTGSLKSSLLTAGAVLSFGLLSAVLAQSTTNLPGRLDPTTYKAGGEGVGYHDLTNGNAGGAFRNDNVDIDINEDQIGGCPYNIGWIDDGEWVAYDVNITSAFTQAQIRVASGYATPKSIDVLIDGALFTTVSFIGTTSNPVWPGCWQKWTYAFSDVNQAKFTPPLGNHTMKLVFHGAGFNVGAVYFTNTPAYNKIQAGAPVLTTFAAMYTEAVDSTVGNDLGEFRADGVDIEKYLGSTYGFGYNVGSVNNGDVLRYRISLENAGTFALKARIASAWGGQKNFSVFVAPVSSAPLASINPATSAIAGWNFSTYSNYGWQVWENVEGISTQGVGATNTLPAGNYDVFFVTQSNGFNLYSFDLLVR